MKSYVKSYNCRKLVKNVFGYILTNHHKYLITINYNANKMYCEMLYVVCNLYVAFE